MSNEKRNAEISKMLDRQARDAAMIQRKVVESFENITPEDLAKIPIEKRIQIFDELEKIKNQK